MPKWIGALVPGSLLVLAAMPAQAAPYAVNDFVLGAQVPPAAFRDYRCGPSEQFDGFVWCQRNRPGGARRGPFNVTQSLLHSRDGKIAYINRQQAPVEFEGNTVDDDIRSFSRRFGSQPRITKLPRRGGLEGVMALWGDVAIEPLDADSVKVLADGRSPRKGFLVDFAGNLTRSAQDGLPIYRITGGAGFIWAASFDQRGRGTLRVTAVDASVLSPAPADAPPPKPVAESPSPEAAAAPAQLATAAEPPSGTGRVRTEIVDPKDSAGREGRTPGRRRAAGDGEGGEGHRGVGEGRTDERGAGEHDRRRSRRALTCRPPTRGAPVRPAKPARRTTNSRGCAPQPDWRSRSSRAC